MDQPPSKRLARRGDGTRGTRQLPSEVHNPVRDDKDEQSGANGRALLHTPSDAPESAFPEASAPVAPSEQQMRPPESVTLDDGGAVVVEAVEQPTVVGMERNRAVHPDRDVTFEDIDHPLHDISPTAAHSSTPSDWQPWDHAGMLNGCSRLRTAGTTGTRLARLCNVSDFQVHDSVLDRLRRASEASPFFMLDYKLADEESSIDELDTTLSGLEPVRSTCRLLPTTKLYLDALVESGDQDARTMSRLVQTADREKLSQLVTSMENRRWPSPNYRTIRHVARSAHAPELWGRKLSDELRSKVLRRCALVDGDAVLDWLAHAASSHPKRMKSMRAFEMTNRSRIFSIAPIPLLFLSDTAANYAFRILRTAAVFACHRPDSSPGMRDTRVILERDIREATRWLQVEPRAPTFIPDLFGTIPWGEEGSLLAEPQWTRRLEVQEKNRATTILCARSPMRTLSLPVNILLEYQAVKSLKRSQVEGGGGMDPNSSTHAETVPNEGACDSQPLSDSSCSIRSEDCLSDVASGEAGIADELLNAESDFDDTEFGGLESPVGDNDAREMDFKSEMDAGQVNVSLEEVRKEGGQAMATPKNEEDADGIRPVRSDNIARQAGTYESDVHDDENLESGSESKLANSGFPPSEGSYDFADASSDTSSAGHEEYLHGDGGGEDGLPCDVSSGDDNSSGVAGTESNEDVHEYSDDLITFLQTTASLDWARAAGTLCYHRLAWLALHYCGIEYMDAFDSPGCCGDDRLPEDCEYESCPMYAAACGYAPFGACRRSGRVDLSRSGMDALFVVVDHLVRSTAELLALCADHDEQRPWIDHTDVLLFTSIRKLPYDYMGLFEKREGENASLSDNEDVVDIDEDEKVNVDEIGGTGFSMPGDGTAWHYVDMELSLNHGQLETEEIGDRAPSQNVSTGSGQKSKKRKRAERQTVYREGAAANVTNEPSPTSSQGKPGKVKPSKAERRQLMKQRRQEKKMLKRLAKQKQTEETERKGDGGVVGHSSKKAAELFFEDRGKDQGALNSLADEVTAGKTQEDLNI